MICRGNKTNGYLGRRKRENNLGAENEMKCERGVAEEREGMGEMKQFTSRPNV